MVSRFHPYGAEYGARSATGARELARERISYDESRDASRDARAHGIHHLRYNAGDSIARYDDGRVASRATADTVVITGSGSERNLGYPTLSTAFEFGSDRSLERTIVEDDDVPWDAMSA